MEIVNRISRMAAIAAKTLVTDVKIGLVSTPGAVGPGQLNLIQAARKMADLTVVSIFVNRLEFSSEEELKRYPRDITADIDLLRRENVDYVFTPSADELYPADLTSSVEVRSLGNDLAELPPFLSTGMATGALKILHITMPAYTFYGEQDAVQAAIVRKMVRDLNLSTEVVLAPGAREPSGLAYSGRNRLLSDLQSAQALVLHRSLNAAENAIASGESNPKKILSEVTRMVESESAVQMSYAVIMDPELRQHVSRIEGPVIIGVGGKIGNIFLSDAVIAGKTGLH